MKIKETELKNSNIHALIYIYPFLFVYFCNGVIPFVMLFSTSHTIKVFKFASKYF